MANAGNASGTGTSNTAGFSAQAQSGAGSRIRTKPTTAPANTTVTGSVGGLVTMNWTAAPDDGAVSVDGYLVAVGSTQSTVPTPGTSFSGVPVGTSNWSIRAHNGNGYGPPATGTVTIPSNTAPAGGAAALRAALGMSENTSQFEGNIVTRWTNNYTPTGTAVAFNYVNTYAYSGVGNAPTAGGGWGFGAVGQPVCVVRTTSRNAAGTTFANLYNLPQIISGVGNTGFQDVGRWIEALAVAQGNVTQYCRLFWEFDLDAYPWGCGWDGGVHAGAAGATATNTIDNFNQAYRIAVNNIRAGMSNPALVKFTLCGTPGVGGGLAHLFSGAPDAFNHAHDFWDKIVGGVSGGAPGIGDLVSVFDPDTYSNTGISIPSPLTWLPDELGMIGDWCITNGFEIGHGEFGIGQLPQSGSSHPWSPADWANIHTTWWKSLPATGPGRLRYVLFFDSATIDASVDWRGSSYVSGTYPGTTGVDGTNFANALKAGWQ